MEPKRKALAAAQEKLSKIKGKIKGDKLFIDNYFSVCLLTMHVRMYNKLCNYIIATRIINECECVSLSAL